MKEEKIKDILKENITGQKLIKDCIFYTIGEGLTDEDIKGIDTIEEFENKLDEKGVNCIKVYTKEERIVYRQTINKEEEKSKIDKEKREQEIDENSDDFETVYSKLFEYSKESLKPNQTNANSSGLPTILIKEYAKRQTGKPVNYIEAEIDGDSGGRPCPPIRVIDIEYNTTSEIKDKTKGGNDAMANASTTQNDVITQGGNSTTQSIVKQTDIVKQLSNAFNTSNKPLETSLKTYILGTPTHVSSFMVQDNGIFYLFDTTGHTHQTQQKQTRETQILKTQESRARRLESQIQRKLRALTLRLQLQQPEQLQQQPVQLQQQPPALQPQIQILQAQLQWTLRPQPQTRQPEQLQQPPVQLQQQSQLQQRLQALQLQLQIQQLRIQRLRIHQDLRLLVLKLRSQEQQNKVLYYTSELTLDKEKIPLSPNNGQQQGSGDTIQPVSLNPFGLDYQNGSSACGIWTSNVLAVASTYESIKDFIIKDEKEAYVAMFKSEFILKVSAKVAKELSVSPEVKILKQKDDLPPEGYCKCKVGNTFFAIDTTYNVGSCLNINSVLLSVSQKELEFYNVDRINNEIIKEREQLIKRIEIEKTKCETAVCTTEASNVAKLKMQEVAVNQDTLKLKITELKKAIEQDINKLEKVKSNITKLKEAKVKETELKMAELKQIKSEIAELEEIESERAKLEKSGSEEVGSEEAELEGIELEGAKLKKIKSEITKMKKVKSEKAELKEAELNKINSDIEKLKKAELNATELKKVIEQDLTELNNIEQSVTESKTDKLEEINKNIIELKETVAKKQSDCYSIFIESFAKILNIKNDSNDNAKDNIVDIAKDDSTKNDIAEDNNVKNDNIENNNAKNDNDVSETIKEIKFCCGEPIKTTNNQLNHAQKVDELFIRYKERQNEQINQFQQNNTEPQQSNYSIGSR